MNQDTIRNVATYAIHLKAGDTLLHRNFARTVTSVEYDPVTEKVSVQADYAHEAGESGECLSFSAHDRVKKLETI